MSNEIELFVALYTDEDITNLIAKLLRERGFNAISARDVGMLQKSDDEQLEYAVERKMTILVYNRDDFLEIDKKSGTAIFRYRKLGDEHYRNALNYALLAATNSRIVASTGRSTRTKMALTEYDLVG